MFSLAGDQLISVCVCVCVCVLRYIQNTIINSGRCLSLCRQLQDIAGAGEFDR